ncbi:hypothetical protein PTSG_00478 [Salpingoeca rosetta]|uniref:Transmembrane protein 192 n=1 Tax=Salpingoeca rosetta (strain ATCC 50818 / BSB-021) TaxID=946362 RepID=F2TWK9_SALR5|nr:uncharacterized protein PTSG_00478 [Salpingoeca rosetta]EGD72455.1 hypothetical protein PTSG_00478 [Salpingoeca rosetta]|eukprot:XP_004999024.1 hypothetical protein PTSG_00478 [Salpingoeca rosetta]
MVSLSDKRYANAFGTGTNAAARETSALLDSSSSNSSRFASHKSINRGGAVARGPINGPPLSSGSRRVPAPRHTNKKHIGVVVPVAIGILLMCGLEAVLFVPPFRLGTHLLDAHKAPYAFLCIIHVAVWLVLVGIYRYGEHCHHNSRLMGYLRFYRDTQLLRRVPVIGMSLVNAILLVFTSFWSTNDEATMDRQNLIQIIVSVEMAISLPSYIIYLVKVIRFNRSRAPPDAHVEFQLNGNSTISMDAGEMDGDVDVDDLLERQSDMLKYMRQYTANLQTEIFALQAELRLTR